MFLDAEIPHFSEICLQKKIRVLHPWFCIHPASTDPIQNVLSQLLAALETGSGTGMDLNPGSADNSLREDLLSGRMVDVIDSGEPAIMVCHWPGIYFNGEHVGFNILKEIKKRLDQKYDHLIWMKLSEIARYWAARELTKTEFNGKNSFIICAFRCNRALP